MREVLQILRDELKLAMMLSGKRDGTLATVHAVSVIVMQVVAHHQRLILIELSTSHITIELGYDCC